MRDGDAIPLPFKIGAALALAVLLVPVLIVVLTGLNSGDYLTFPRKGCRLLDAHPYRNARMRPAPRPAWALRGI